MRSKTIPAKYLLRALELEGYQVKRSNGSHAVYAGKHGGNVVVVRSTGDVPMFHVRWVLEAAGIPRARFLANIARAKSEPRKIYTLLGTILAKPNEEAQRSATQQAMQPVKKADDASNRKTPVAR